MTTSNEDRPPSFWSGGWDVKFILHSDQGCAKSHHSRRWAVQWHAAPKPDAFQVRKVCVSAACRGEYSDRQRHYIESAIARRIDAAAAGVRTYAQAYTAYGPLVADIAHAIKAGATPPELPSIDWQARALSELIALSGNPDLTAAMAWRRFAEERLDESGQALLSRLDNLDETVDVTVGFDTDWHDDWGTAEDPRCSEDRHGLDYYWGREYRRWFDLTVDAMMLGTLGITPATPTATVDLRTTALLDALLRQTFAGYADRYDFHGPVGIAFASLCGAKHATWEDVPPLVNPESAHLLDAAFAVIQ